MALCMSHTAMYVAVRLLLRERADIATPAFSMLF